MNTCRSDLCAQGRNACPTPLACETPELDEAAELLHAYRVVGAWLALTLISFALAGFIAGVFSN